MINRATESPSFCRLQVRYEKMVFVVVPSVFVSFRKIRKFMVKIVVRELSRRRNYDCFNAFFFVI